MLSSTAPSRLSVSDHVPARWWSYLLVGLTVGFSLWISFVQPPDGGYFTTDEQFIADSGVFMLYGATPRCLDWPGIPMVLVFYLLALGQVVINLIAAAAAGPLSAVGVFGVVDQTAYTYLLDRVPLIVAGRLVQILLVAGLLVWCVRIIHRAVPTLLPPALRLPLVAIICLQYDALTNPSVIRPEGLGYALFAVASLLILFGGFPARSWRQPAVVVLLIALLISHRLLFMFTFPFLLGGLLFRMGFTVRRTLAVLGTLVLAVLLTMPFIWTDSFVLLKAFAGGMLMKVAGTQTSFFNWDYIRTMVLPAPTVWQVLLLPIGAVAFWRWYPNRGVALLLIGNLLLLTVSIFHSSTIYITHTLPLRTLSLLLLAYAAWGLYQVSGRRWLLYGVTAAIALANVAESLLLETDLLRTSTFWQAAEFLKTLTANTPVLIESDFDNITPRSRQTLLRELQAIQDQSLTQKKYNRQFGGDVGTSLPVALRTSLSEDDRLAILQRQIQAQYTPPNRYVDLTYMAPTTGYINYFVEQKSGIDDFLAGRYTYLITRYGMRYPMVARFDTPSHSGTIYVYKTLAKPDSL